MDDPQAGPASLAPENAAVTAALDVLRAHHDPGAPPGTTPAPDPAVYASPEVVLALAAAFHGKCAYCESPLESIDASNVDHFRPPSDAVGTDGVPDPPSYWWLAYTWDNLLLSCHDCLKTKGRRFPVAGPRLRPGAPLVDEQALLLNPRSPEDNPERWLVFLDDGTVSSDTERGRATIDILGLNRSRLVRARRAAAASELETIAAATAGEAGTTHAAVPGVLDPATPFLALRRQVWAEQTADASLTPAPAEPQVRSATKASFQAAQAAKQAVTLDDDLSNTDRSQYVDYYGATRWIDRIEVENVRPIRRLVVDLDRSTATTAPWLTLLGDNGSGKSSLLQAVALTLVGADYRRHLGLTPDDLLRRGARRGFVKIWFNTLPAPVELHFRAGEADFTGSQAPQVMVLAYGATRLRASEGHEVRRSDVAHVENLFDARHELTDPNRWLLSLPADTFALIARTLHRLLALEEHNAIERDLARGTVSIRYGRKLDPFKDLSDGYQSMLVLTCDILRTTLALWPGPEQAEGIAILDEIGTHLHPRWRMRIVGALRSVLPRMQFLVSTHDPLCLRGLEDGEVVVLNRTTDGEIVTLTDLPPVKGLRVDQLLTSEHFGLGSVQDPDLDRLYEEYYALRGVDRPDAAQRRRVADLEDELGRLRQLGTTERERIMLSAADEIIVRRRQKGDAAVRADLRDDVAAIWDAARRGHAR